MEKCILGWGQGVKLWSKNTWEKQWASLVDTDPQVEWLRQQWDRAAEIYRKQQKDKSEL